MNKPTWDTAPEWAQWLIQDEVDIWHWFENEPAPYGDGWVSNGGRFQAATKPPIVIDAKYGLERRPQIKVVANED